MRVFVKSFGCSANLADGAVLAGCLIEAGHELVDSMECADIVVLNTCGVKGPTENRMIEISSNAPESAKLIIAGCLPLINFDRIHKEVQYDGIVSPSVGENIVQIVDHVSKGEKIVSLDKGLSDMPRLTLPRKKLSPVISLVPINYGCLGACAYCCVVHARGRLRSHSTGEVVERVKEDVASGLREFWLTSQDTACYGKDRNTSLPELLNALCMVPADFKIRVGMMTPNIAVEMLDDLINSFRDEKIFKFLHLPVQSGSDHVLKKMQRSYLVEDFKTVVNTFRTKFPEMTLATDVICGFPSEDTEAFEQTLRLIEEVKPDVVNVSKFFPRPRTAAANMRKDFVSSDEIKRRSRETSTLTRRVAFERNQRWIGWTGNVLIDEVGKVSGSLVGRNFAYKPVVIKNSRDYLLGKTVHVKVSKAFGTYLEGQRIE